MSLQQIEAHLVLSESFCKLSLKAVLSCQTAEESLNQLGSDGTVELDRLKHVLVKIGMNAIDADTVLDTSQSDGKIKISEFMAWLSAKSGKLQCVGWKDNIILATDSYKFSHWKQYPPGTEYVPLGSFRNACFCSLHNEPW